MKRWILPAIGFAVSFVILAILFREAYQNDQFAELWEAPKQWGQLALGLAAAFSAISVTFVRWFMLVRALGIPFRLRDAFRLGFIGFFLNFFTVGVVGGDALKAVFIARLNPRQRAESVASVVIDRLIGLFALFLMTSIAMLLFRSELGLDQVSSTGTESAERQTVRVVTNVAVGLTLLGTIGLFVLQFARAMTSFLERTLFQLPLVGNLLKRLHLAAVTYQHHQLVLFGSIGMSLVVHGLNAIAIYLIAVGLPGTHPGFPAHFVIVPLSMVAGALPLPGGMGSFEWTLDFLYGGVATSDGENNGLLVAFGYRLITLLIAAVGVVFYFLSKAEIRGLVSEAKHQDDAIDETLDEIAESESRSTDASSSREGD